MELKNGNFSFSHFFFSTLDNFTKKTYENTCDFYNIFSNSISNCTHLPSFTMWMFFLKKLSRPFQSNIHSLNFEMLLPENLWKDMTYFKVHITICKLTIFCHLKIFTKNIAAFSKCSQIINHFGNFKQRFPQNIWKDLPIFWHF